MSFDLQFYLTCDLPCHFRVAMSKLLLSSHNLFIETGRWHRPRSIPREDRTCNICNKLEDEYHFIIECSLYTDLRRKYIPRCYWCNPNMFTLQELFCSKNRNLILRLSTYIYKVVQLRYDNNWIYYNKFQSTVVAIHRYLIML